MQLTEWIDHDPSFIRHRYNRIAGFFPFFELLFLLPRGIRRKAVDHLQLKPGDSVLEIGCRTGRNIPFLREAVGPQGHIFGVDLSEGMFSKARQLCAKRKWENVTLSVKEIRKMKEPVARLAWIVKVAVALTFFNSWVLFEETIVDRHGLWRYLPFYKIGLFCT